MVVNLKQSLVALTHPKNSRSGGGGGTFQAIGGPFVENRRSQLKTKCPNPFSLIPYAINTGNPLQIDQEVAFSNRLPVRQDRLDQKEAVLQQLKTQLKRHAALAQHGHEARVRGWEGRGTSIGLDVLRGCGIYGV